MLKADIRVAFERLSHVPLGFDPDRVLVVNVDTERARTNPADRMQLYERIVEAARGTPGGQPAIPQLGREDRKLRRQPEQPDRRQLEHRQSRPVLQAVVADRPAQLSDEQGQAVREASGDMRLGRGHEPNIKGTE